MKKCTKCKTVKTDDSFTKLKASKDGLFGVCKPCHALQSKKWKLEWEERWGVSHAHHIKCRGYGITTRQYQDMLNDQDGACAICGLPETTIGRGGRAAPLAIDHCHTTGKVRGLLCRKCNGGIGLLRDSIDLLTSATSYLKQYELVKD